MRVTVVLQGQNVKNMFKYYWLTQARRKIREDGTRALLADRGIDVVDPKDILTSPFQREAVPVRPTLAETFAPPPPERRDTPCHVFTHKFSPIMGLCQAQLITNTLTRPALPQAVTEHAAATAANTSPELDERVKEAILHAHLLDSYQRRLPRVLDVVNNPGWIFPLDYGIPVCRKNKTLNYQLLLLLDQVEGCGLERQLVEDSSTTLMLPHGNRLMQMRHDAGYLLSSPDPLPPMATQGEVLEASEGEDMPDLYPLSPFSNCRARDTYPTEECYAVASPHLYPHTIFMHHNQPRMPHAEDVFKGMSLLYAFSHAAAYAKLVQKHSLGDLDKPITVQVVHINGPQYHLGVFQLNTLNLAPSASDKAVRNIFWTQDWETLFDSCKFKAGRAVLEGYNPKVFSLLRGLHVQG